MKTLLWEQIGSTTKIVEEFEKRDEASKKLYDRLIILDTCNDRFEYSKFGYIIERAKGIGSASLTFSKLKKNGIYIPTILKYSSKRKETFEEEYMDIMLPEDEVIYFEAQGENDRHGFYKKFETSGIISEEKNYGDCSYCYKIIGFRITKS